MFEYKSRQAEIHTLKEYGWKHQVDIFKSSIALYERLVFKF